MDKEEIKEMILWYAVDYLSDGTIIHYGYDDEKPNSTGNVEIRTEKLKTEIFYLNEGG